MPISQIYNTFQPVWHHIQPVLNTIPPLLQNGKDFVNRFVDISKVAQGVNVVAQKIFGYSSYLRQDHSSFVFSALWLPFSGYNAWESMKEVKKISLSDTESLFDISTAFGQVGIFCNQTLHVLQKINIQSIGLVSIKSCLIAFGLLSFLGRFSTNIIEMLYTKNIDQVKASRLSLLATTLDLMGVVTLSLAICTPIGYTFLTISVVVSISRNAYNPPDKPDFS